MSKPPPEREEAIVAENTCTFTELIAAAEAQGFEVRRGVIFPDGRPVLLANDQ